MTEGWSEFISQIQLVGSPQIDAGNLHDCGGRGWQHPRLPGHTLTGQVVIGVILDVAPQKTLPRPVSTATGINWFAFSACEGVPPCVVGLDNQNGRRELTGDSTAPQKALGP
jgi:hypothetical protein